MSFFFLLKHQSRKSLYYLNIGEDHFAERPLSKLILYQFWIYITGHSSNNVCVASFSLPVLVSSVVTVKTYQLCSLFVAYKTLNNEQMKTTELRQC